MCIRDRETLGKVSHEVAEDLALGEYEKYRVEQDRNYVSDFDEVALRALENAKSAKKLKKKKV